MARLRGQEKQSDDEYIENFARLLNIFDRATQSDKKTPHFNNFEHVFVLDIQTNIGFL